MHWRAEAIRSPFKQSGDKGIKYSRNQVIKGASFQVVYTRGLRRLEARLSNQAVKGSSIQEIKK